MGTASSTRIAGLSRERIGLAALNSAPYMIFLWMVYTVFCVSVDDPFITFRYAANFVAGHGPVFNIGERVEGFSSWLHLALCVLLLKLLPSLGVLFKAKLASAAFGFALIAQTGRLAKHIGFSPRSALCAQVLLAFNINFAVTAVNGLETTMYACILLAAVTRFLAEQKSQRGIGSALLLFIALLARPETLLVFVAMLAVRWTKVRRSRSTVAGWSAAFIVPAVLMFGLRYAYFGYPLPNTYYAKSPALWTGLKDGVVYLSRILSTEKVTIFRWNRFLTEYRAHVPVRRLIELGLAPLYPAFFWLAVVAGARRERSKDYAPLFVAIIAATLFFVLRAGGDWMPGWRFLIPVLPYFVLFQVASLRGLRTKLVSASDVIPQADGEKLQFSYRGMILAAFLTMYLLSAMLPVPQSWGRSGFATSDSELLRQSSVGARAWVALGSTIQQNLPPGSVVLYSEMGYGPYLNLDKKFVDILGLTDARVAHFPNWQHNKFGVESVGWYSDAAPASARIAHERIDWMVLTRWFPPLPASLPASSPFSGYRAVTTVTEPGGTEMYGWVYRKEETSIGLP